jgi:hypothetical protein
MTYTGAPPIIFARDLPAAVSPHTDIWCRADNGEQALVQAATRTGDEVVITVAICSWPQPDTIRTFTVPADGRISTRIY